MKFTVPYEILTTNDGSPSLRFKGRYAEESMHSHAGAFSETLYIYGSAFDHISEEQRLSVLSVGLGLGYNEILSQCVSLKRNTNLYLESYEKDPFLIQQFEQWVFDQKSSLSPLYTDICRRFTDHFNLELETVKEHLQKNIKDKNLKLKKSLAFTTRFEKNFNVVLYDAFCSRTSPELWQDSFLSLILEQTSPKQSVFTTYACKSNLNTVLKNHNFKIVKKPGFAHKRECTLAYK